MTTQNNGSMTALEAGRRLYCSRQAMRLPLNGCPRGAPEAAPAELLDAAAAREPLRLREPRHHAAAYRGQAAAGIGRCTGRMCAA